MSPAGDETRGIKENADLVLLEESLDTSGETTDSFGFILHHLLDIHLNIAHLRLVREEEERKAPGFRAG